MNDPQQTVTCPKCGTARPAGIAQCSTCGFGMPPVGVCPRCGANNSSTTTLCQNCGYALAKRKVNPLWIVLFVVFGLPAGCLGGCFLLIASGSPRSVDNGPLFMAGLLALGLFSLLLYLLIRSARR